MTAIRESDSGYRAENGAWETVELPAEFRVNGIHSVMLPTGKVLIVAGSGNNAHHFEAGTFDTILWDPAADTYTKVHTPEDLFCGGHAFLPDGNVLIAGGTRKYEVLQDKVTRAAGVITVVNDAVYEQDLQIKKGDIFTDRATGLRYRSTEDKVVPMVHKLTPGKEPTRTTVWVEAVEEGAQYVFRGEGHQFDWDGHVSAGLYGLADTITLDKQEYWALDASYIFDIHAEKYVPTGRMKQARWYPSLFSVDGGNIVAVSGLNEHGVFIDHGMGTTEEFDVKTQSWISRPDLERAFPTYPALFRGADGRILYTGANAGYGPAEQMRTPGIWDLTDNSFTEISGLRDPGMNETAGSVLLAPAQNQDGLIVGGGSVGDAVGSTARMDVISFDDGKVSAAPDLPTAVRYPGVVNLPTDDVLITGGASDYRGRSGSDVLLASLYTPSTNTLRSVAPPHIGRNYHSEALLLPDGSVLTLGSDPLYGDAEGKSAGTFEQRLEIYRPPYFFTPGERPEILTAPSTITRGKSITVRAKGDIARARLVRPSAVTHMTDTEQRSVELGIKVKGDQLSLSLDKNPNLTPAGWYMLFLVDKSGKPSVATWVEVR
ncbi:MAG: galactose oxidase early set domain-containing protein [Micropruina sp.]|uniref:galactose oxidase-like domain-containing protein n=1 Tax=Micropruina sp. TaxID=2737536 RepID=UPI0039E3F8D3